LAVVVNQLRASHHPDQSLMDEAKAKDWTVISMQNDWKRIFAFD
jgi:hypothetical protein